MHNELGFDQGDRFAVMALNSHNFLELYHAGFLGAGVVNPLNLRLAPKELEFILADSGCNVVLRRPDLRRRSSTSVREAAGRRSRSSSSARATCPTTSPTRT